MSHPVDTARARGLDFVFVGLSITSSWGNGHATTYRALLRALADRGHRALFLERDVPYYARHRDLVAPSYARVELYASMDELRDRFARAVAEADVVVVGSYVPEGVSVAAWVLATARGLAAFYDIDTPVTLQKLARGDLEYIEPSLVPRFDLYLSFTGGPVLGLLESRFGARRARALYCGVDPEAYFPIETPLSWDMGYLGTYSTDRQPTLERLLLEPARARPESRFVVAGPQYPEDLAWPSNVTRIAHLAPSEHRAFYGAQRFTLNVTRADMVEAGWSPSVRLFEAAACGTPIVSDVWPGIASFFQPGREILLVRSTAEARVLREHTAAHRAESLERHAQGALDKRAQRRGIGLGSSERHIHKEGNA
jgi:spore maturation protein CgeB